MTDDYRFWAFVEQMNLFHKLSTDAPENCSTVLAIQLLGHTLGFEPINLIQPDAAHHNCYVTLVGESTLTRKTTSQTFAV